MRKIESIHSHVKFVKKEKAYALLPKEHVPFGYATVGVTYPDPDYHIDRAAGHSINVFEYIEEGEGEICLGGVWTKARAGDVYVLRAGEEHHYRADPQNPWKKRWINYIADYLGAMLDAYGIASGIYPCEDARKYFDLAFEAARFGVYGDSGRTVADCVHKIVSHCAASRAEERPDDAYRIREELNAALYKKLDLDGLCEKLHVSKSNVIRVFKKQYGVTPYEYLLAAKIEAAKILLATTALPVREIADRLCISDEHYFSTLFLKRVGVRPRAFREMKG
ncbi:MAG: helix-turn-helix domain-containing protein [Clostridia bacterium]|nr:helix-turn-helix domain-containing protein [Clostridia bacterium]